MIKILNFKQLSTIKGGSDNTSEQIDIDRGGGRPKPKNKAATGQMEKNKNLGTLKS